MAAKILLVEDDNNLREIYEARLQAEGYTIATAKDGEEALVVAKAEKPDLIISDVMMPRISGFEMLDILRNTEELKYTKVIMLTALGQADDKTRANSLGADRYLVKSQVTLEDIVKAAHELLDGPNAEGGTAAAAPPPDAPTAPTTPAPTTSTPPTASDNSTPPAAPPTASPPAGPVVVAPTAPTATVSTPPAAAAPTTAVPSEPTTPPGPSAAVATPSTPPAPPPSTPTGVTPAAVPETSALPSPSPTTNSTPVVEPPTSPAPSDAGAPTAAEEQAAIKEQIEDFISQQKPAPAQPAVEPAAAGATSETATATNKDDAVLASAVSDLAANANPPTASPSTTVVAPTTQPTVPVPAVEPAEPKPDKEAAAASNNSVTIAKKKIIQPLSSNARPDLNELLAAEEAKNIMQTGYNPAAAVVSSGGNQNTPTAPPLAAPEAEQSQPAPHPAPQPGSTFAPGSATPPVPGTATKPADFDPNSVAL